MLYAVWTTQYVSPIKLSHFIGDDLDALVHHGLVLGIGDADALVLMLPVFVFQAREKVVTGNDQRIARFEPFIKLGAGAGQILEPEPQEDRPFGFMDAAGDIAEFLAEKFQASGAPFCGRRAVRFPGSFA